MTPHPIPLSVIDTAQELSAAADVLAALREDRTPDELDARWAKQSAEYFARKDQRNV